MVEGPPIEFMTAEEPTRATPITERQLRGLREQVNRWNVPVENIVLPKYKLLFAGTCPCCGFYNENKKPEFKCAQCERKIKFDSKTKFFKEVYKWEDL